MLVCVLNQAVIGSSPTPILLMAGATVGLHLVALVLVLAVVYIIETNANKVQKLSDYGDLRQPQNEHGSTGVAPGTVEQSQKVSDDNGWCSSVRVSVRLSACLNSSISKVGRGRPMK